MPYDQRAWFSTPVKNIMQIKRKLGLGESVKPLISLIPFIDSFLTGKLEPTNDQISTSVSFIAQLLRVSQRYREVTGSNPI